MAKGQGRRSCLGVIFQLITVAIFIFLGSVGIKFFNSSLEEQRGMFLIIMFISSFPTLVFIGLSIFMSRPLHRVLAIMCFFASVLFNVAAVIGIWSSWSLTSTSISLLIGSAVITTFVLIVLHDMKKKTHDRINALNRSNKRNSLGKDEEEPTVEAELDGSTWKETLRPKAVKAKKATKKS